MNRIARLLPLGLLLAQAASAGIAEHVVRSKVAGVDLVLYPTSVKDVVTVLGSLPAGDAFAGEGNAAVPTLVGMMLDKGTTSEDEFAIAQKLESVGAEISFSVSAQMLNVRAKCLRKDLPLLISLIAEQLRSPRFAPADFAKVKQQLTGMLEEGLEHTESRAEEAFSRSVYPAGHPNRLRPTEEYLAAVPKAQLAEVKAFHERYYGPRQLRLIVVGDLDVAQAKAQVSKGFRGWSGGAEVLHAPAAAGAHAAGEIVVPVAGKTSVSVVLGEATGLRYRDPDALALRLGTAILGSGFTGRLFGIVRDREGLTYDIGARVAEDAFTDGDWRITASFAPPLLEKGIASTQRELRRWREDGISAEELAARKTNVIGAYQVSLATTGGLASALQLALDRGYDVTWLDQYPKAVDALTLAQVNAAIKAHIDLARMVLVEAGTVGERKP